jgi:hypothetical protein
MNSQARAPEIVPTAGWLKSSFWPVHSIVLALGLLVGCGGSNTASAPTVTGFTPNSGSAATSTLVTVTGSGFSSGINSVSLGGVPVPTGIVVSDSTLTFTVPATAVTGTIAVAAPGGTATSAAEFLVVPSVSTISTTTGSIAEATPVTFSGYGLMAIDQIQFGTVTAIPTTQTANEIIVHVPLGAPQGSITIYLMLQQQLYGFASIPVPFTVTL